MCYSQYSTLIGKDSINFNLQLNSEFQTNVLIPAQLKVLKCCSSVSFMCEQLNSLIYVCLRPPDECHQCQPQSVI